MPDEIEAGAQFEGGTPYITLDGSPLDDDIAEDLVDVRVEQSLHLPDAFTLRFADHLFEIFDTAQFEIGKAAKIEFQSGDDKEKVTEGEITAVSMEQGVGGRHELVVYGMDKSHRLHRGAQVRTWQDMKDSQAAEEVASDAGLKKDTSATSTKHEYLMQYESDADFLADRAHSVGHGWWLHDGKLLFKPQVAAGSPKTLTWGDNLIKFQVRISAGESVSEAQVRGWDPKTQKSFVGEAKPKNDTKELGSSAAAATEGAKKANSEFKGTRLGVAAPVIDKGEADALAKSVVERGAAEQVVARGEAHGDPTIAPGIDAKIEEVGKRLSGNYLLTSVEHVWGLGRPYKTRFESGGRRPAGLVDLLSRRNGDTGLGNKLIIGIVTDLNDPENQGRIKVKFPTVSDEDNSAFARMLMPGAGKERGMVAHPEINDEVLVGFEHGDLRRPVVLGGLWSDKNTIPKLGDGAVSGGKVDERGWKTTSGHALLFKDKSGSEEISITHKDETALVLGFDKVSLETSHPIEITGDDTYDGKFMGNVTVEGQEITIKAKTKLVLEAPQIEIKAGASVKVKSDGMANFEAGGITVVKGSMVQIN